jgi:hypothetical protein
MYKLSVKKVNFTKLNTTKYFFFYYKFRFKDDLIKNFTNKKIFTKKKSFQWFEKNIKNINLFELTLNKKISGIIYYNTVSKKYFIYILKKYRKKGYSKIYLSKFIKKIKKRKLKLITDVNRHNVQSIKLHELFKKKTIKKKKNFRFILN